ncbi:queuine tRNA-ribosyltransferase tRNA-guanine transglycosylase [Haloarchaeobius amylolyticus]|uniref:queuine tRNA-ribosyltransferase tRNA-guanine transglycosylase n=1 Tax=Haloarchaeobius amylolyticus TaxID=1198296 RepID=UPI00227138F9|nr:queuine tRNA-ribosyltransferase tRNA-guanine transglycosylase [Haloarchaeobius amylolyticus]
MRFYVPEWDDNVDADYDFVHDEHSRLSKEERELQYIWDLFDYETTPIDGVLISREQVEETQRKYDKLTSHGVYGEDSGLHVPEWLPTISDCGAWGYKSLPFPPYGNEGMLEFYEEMDVTVGVTIDHLVLGSGHASRLYLDKRAFSGGFSKSDLPDKLTEAVNVMVDSWPETWPSYVAEYEPSIVGTSEEIEPFTSSDFEGDVTSVIERLADDPRAVYRDDDMQFRYDLTLDNAAEMADLYREGDYSFRLMVAIQGWDPSSYAKAMRHVLGMGYDYVGIGGVAGSSTKAVRNIVDEVGTVVEDYQEAHETRIDTHVFGFAKTDAFDDIGENHVSSFDSASMLRAAWTGGENYHLDDERRYDAFRVRFASNRDDRKTAIEKALRGQEILHAFRAYDNGEPISEALEEWHNAAREALSALPDYLARHRWDPANGGRTLRPIESHFREDFEHAGALKASFGDPFRSQLVKLLREDEPEDPIDFGRYLALIKEAESVFEQGYPWLLEKVKEREESGETVPSINQLLLLLSDYAEFIGDDRLLDQYYATARSEPWRECGCRICQDVGVEVAIFRGNNRNRRRGFHNTRRFYDQFEDSLPKVLVATIGDSTIAGADSIESYLATEHSEFWSAAHGLPVVEVGAVTAKGVHEWWEDPPRSISFDPDRIAEELADHCIRYQELYLYGDVDNAIVEKIQNVGCGVHVFQDVTALERAVRERIGFAGEEQKATQAGLGEW